MQAPPHVPPRGGADPPCRGDGEGPYREGMRTRHLSITVTAYDDGTYALAYVVRTYARGESRGRQVVARKASDRDSVIHLATVAVEAMVTEEDERQRQEDVQYYEGGAG